MDVEDFDEEIDSFDGNEENSHDIMNEDVPHDNAAASIMDALDVDPASQVVTETNAKQPRALSVIDEILVNRSQPEPEQDLEDHFDYEKAELDEKSIDENVTTDAAIEDEVTSAQMSVVDDGDKENISANGDETFVRQIVSQLPLSKIKKIMKMDPDTKLIQNESIILVAFATELFIKTLSTAAARVAVKSKRKTVKKEDIDNCIQNFHYFEFLEDMV